MLKPPEFYNLLSDETRLRCLMLLYKKQKLCVCELVETLECSQPKVSRHLSMLRKSGIVLDERKGQWIYYSLNSALPEWISNIIASSLENLAKVEPYRSDIKRVQSSKKESVCN